jgi:gliding motility-associated-like protein
LLSQASIIDKPATLYDGPQFPDLQFIPNHGQWDGPHDFEAVLGSSKLFVEPHALVYKMIDPASLPRHVGAYSQLPPPRIKGHTFKTSFLEASQNAQWHGLSKKEAYHNYYLGKDPSRWKSDIELYGAILNKNLYTHIDMKLYQAAGLLKYDFIVKPQGDPNQIKMYYEGVDDLYIHEGQLHIKTTVGDIIEKQPYAYQYIGDQLLEVQCRFIQNDHIISFEFPEGYQSGYELIIDPILVFSTFSGSTGDNFGVTAAFDVNGNGYAAGMQFATGYPVTLGAFDVAFNDRPDLFPIRTIDVSISKFNPSGTNLLYATYLGGNEIDVPHSIVVNSNEELIVMGSTSSTDFPVTSGAFDVTFNDGPAIIVQGNYQYINSSDLFLTVFSPDGRNLRASTFIGGSGNDGINNSFELVGNYSDEFRGEVNVDINDNIYIASTTTSINYPTTPGAWNTANNGGQYDAVISKFNPTLTNLIWSTYFGGNDKDVAYSMKIDAQSKVYFTGGTVSTNLPTTANAINPGYLGGQSDGYLARLSADGSTIEACTYLGTAGRDQSYFIEIDPAGQVFALGDARSGGYPVTPGRYAIPGSVQFVHKLKPDLDSTFFSTVFGNGLRSGRLVLNTFMIDDCYRIYISAWGGNANFRDENNTVTNIFNMPITSDAFQLTTDGSDFYFLVLKPDARDIEYGTYFGGTAEVGEHVDGGTSRFDRRGIVYQAVCAGCGGTSDFPTSSNAFSRLNGSDNCNIALIKFDFQLDEIVVNAQVSPSLMGCAPFQVSFTNLSRGPVDEFFWDFGDGANSEDLNPSYTYEAGTYQIQLIGKSEFDCVDPDTAFLTLVVVDPEETTNEELFKCPEDDITFSSKHQSAGANYEWIDNLSSTASLSVMSPGVYWVKTTSGAGCFVDSFTVTDLPIPSSSIDIGGCEPEDYILRPPFPDPNLSYIWQDGSTNQTLTALDAGVYWVRTLDPIECDRIDSFIIDEYPLKQPIIHDIDLCPGKSTYILATDRGPGITHMWQDGSTNDSLLIDGDGVYWVVSTFPDECPLTDSFIVQPALFNDITLDSLRICEESSIEISSKQLQAGGSYLWSTGDTTPTIFVTETGLYEVTTDFDRVCPFTNQYYVRTYPVIDQNDIYFPTAFSPNNDGVNDIFKPFFSDLVDVLSYELKIYNRWGQKVFESRNQNIGWNGEDIDQQEAVAVYVWYSQVAVISCTGDPLDLLMKGDVTIVK